MKRPSSAALFVGLALVACSDKKAVPSAATQQSPNANLLPAPLASTSEPSGASPVHSAGTSIGIPADSAGHLLVREPEPPAPETAPPDKPLPDDTLTPKDSSGYEIEGAFHWADVAPPLPIPELSISAVHDALAKTELGVTVDLATAGRMRLSFESAAFPLPAHTELRARTDYYGHALVWPSGAAYRVLSPGSLRATLAERRADMTPLLRAKVTPGETGTFLDRKTLKTIVETSLGALTLEQAAVPGSGAAGELFCRLLVELVGAEPTTEACKSERIPVAAHYKWATSGSISFVATSFVEKKDLPLGYLFVPPAGAAFSPGELPPPTSGIFLNRDDLAKFRSHAVHVAPSPHAPGEGVTADNQTTELQYLLVDGVPVAWVKPKSTQYVIGPLSGHYSIAWRDFFGTNVSAPTTTDLPALVRVGSLDVDGGR
jgi:hypothetical protein